MFEGTRTQEPNRCAAHIVNLVVQSRLGIIEPTIDNFRVLCRKIRKSCSLMNQLASRFAERGTVFIEPKLDVPTR